MGKRNYFQNATTEVGTVSFWRDLAAEFVATFMLMSIQSALPLHWIENPDHVNDFAVGNAVQVSMGMGFIVTTMAWTFGDFGGAHMNPAVTIAMMLSLKIGFIRGFLYIIIQCGACICGAFFIYAVTPDEFRESLAATGLGPKMQPWQGFLVEAWITCILVFTVYGATNSKRKQHLLMHCIPIGMAVTVGIMAAIMHTGASMNPARSLGPAVVLSKWDGHWVYWAGPISGGIVATVIYVVMFDRPDRPKNSTETEDTDLSSEKASALGVHVVE